MRESNNRLVSRTTSAPNVGLKSGGGSGKDKPFKENALKIIRDKTAFHYDRLNLAEAFGNLAAGENSLYLAQHPANTLYYMGSALVFRTAFAMIADTVEGAVNGSHEERVRKGTQIALDDARNANTHMHEVLYGLIELLMDDVLGRPAENEQQVRNAGAISSARLISKLVTSMPIVRAAA
jgi:hypothetical protein